MKLEAIENAPTFAEKWGEKSSPYVLPNEETITDKCNKLCYLTIKGQEHSITNTNPNIITIVQKPTKEVFAGFELFFIFEKYGLLKWRFRTVDIDGNEEIHKIGRYSTVKEYTQTYLDKYNKFKNK